MSGFRIVGQMNIHLTLFDLVRVWEPGQRIEWLDSGSNPVDPYAEAEAQFKLLFAKTAKIRALQSQLVAERDRRELRHCQTLTGGIWYPDAPLPSDVNPADFRAVARVNRFGGHTKESVDFYAVAQHLWLCSEWVRLNGGSRQDMYDAHTHDLEEIYPPGDQLGPILRGEPPDSALIMMSRKAKVAVRTAIGATLVKSEIVSTADRVLLATEKRDLLNTPSDAVKWTELPPPWDAALIEPWSAGRAWAVWSFRFNALADVLDKPLRIPGV